MEAKEKKKPNQKEHFRLTEAAASWKAVPKTRPTLIFIDYSVTFQKLKPQLHL
jgi:hypothetical protein